MTTPDMFDKLADNWDDNPRMIERSSTFVTHIRRNVPLSKHVRALDFGCGTGQVGIRLSPEVRSIAMVDNSEGMLTVLRKKIARAGINNLRIHYGDLFNQDLETQGYDLAYSLMAIHHAKEISALLLRFHELLKPGGYLCIGDLEPEDGSFHGEDMDVHHGFAPYELEKQLSSIGFSHIRHVRMLTMERPLQNGKNRKFPVFFLVAQKD